MVNPTFGALGLFWQGEWSRCEAAVEAVLSGSRINDVATVDLNTSSTLVGDHVLQTYDIRHVARGSNIGIKGKTQFKRVGEVFKPKPRLGSVSSTALLTSGWDTACTEPGEASSVIQTEPKEIVETQVNLELTLGFHCQ